MLQRLSNAVPLCKVVARPSFCSERPSNRSNQTQYHLVEKWTIPRQRHVFKRSLTYSFTSIKLLFLSFTSLSSHVKCLLCKDSSYLPSLAFGSNGVQQRTFIQEKHYSTRDIRELTARDFARLSMPAPSHFVIILHNFWSSCLPGPSAHLSILAEKWEPQLSHCRHIRASMSVPMSMLKHFTAVQAIKLQFPSSRCRME